MKKPEPASETLSNMSRVVPWQLKHISFRQDARYVPIKKVSSGVLMMKDLKPTEEVNLIKMRDDGSNSTSTQQNASTALNESAAPAAAPEAPPSMPLLSEE